MKSGFSLIELVIAMAIVAILVAIAYPSYHNYIVNARRTDGQTALLDLASRMEQYYSENHTYQTATIAAGGATDVMDSATSPEGWYVLSISNATPTTYTLQATPQNSQATGDTRCQTLTLNQLGIKDITAGPAGAPTSTAEACWS